MNPETHSCDCGYTWRHGHDGTHFCGPQYRATIERQAQEIAALKAASPVIECVKLSESPSLSTAKAALASLHDHRKYGGVFPTSALVILENLVESMKNIPATSQPAIQEKEQDHEQLARRKWTVKQWYEHVGAWENAQGEVCFGSVMALGAMLKLMAKARHSADPVTQQDAIDALIENHRIEIIPEYEGGFHARVYQDSENPLASFHATTVRAAVEGAIDAASDKDQ